MPPFHRIILFDEDSSQDTYMYTHKHLIYAETRSRFVWLYHDEHHTNRTAKIHNYQDESLHMIEDLLRGAITPLPYPLKNTHSDTQRRTQL